ncbi:MAG: hypothetical protein ACI9WU_000490 [Myxococcota bacterium]|jgi:hypothetical protein
MMKNALAVLSIVSLTLFFGCGEHEAVSEMNGFADEVCACKDMKCLTESTKKLTDLAKKHAETKVTQGDADKIKGATERATKCITELPAKLAAPK